MEKILLVEDNVEYGKMLTKILSETGYQVDYFSDPLEAIECTVKNQYDLIISDYELGVMTGIRLIKTVRNIQGGIKAIVLTGFEDERFEFEAIENEVDMFLGKDKSMKLILTYIQQVLKQEKKSVGDVTELSSKAEKIVLVKERHEVYKNGVLVELTPKEFQLLEYFLENKKKKITRKEMIEKLWLVEFEEMEPRVIDVHIKNLREKLNIFSIVSIRGQGYKWNE